jgi:type II secretory pathway component PulJ
MKPQQLRRGAVRRGTTLLELVAASTIIATALVPALRIMRDSLRISRQLEVREAMATIAMSVLEQESARVSAQWAMQTTTHRDPGRNSGYPSVLAVSTTSDSQATGGIPGSVAVINVTAFEDLNRTGSLDEDEPSITFATKIAGLTSYQFEAQGS